MNDPRQPLYGPPHPPQPAGTPQRQAPHPPPARPPATPSSIRSASMPPQGPQPVELDSEPLALVEEAPEPVGLTAPAPGIHSPPKKILTFGPETVHRKTDFKRPTHNTGTGATRVKSFHGKYSEQGLEYLDNAINEWLDSNVDVEVKFVTSTVMTFEGKIREPALVLNLWY